MGTEDSRAYWERRLTGDVSLRTVGWLGLGASFNAWMYRIRARQFRRLMRRYVTSGSRVLDVGAGSGFYVDLWQRLGARVDGCDITQASVDALRVRFPNSRFERVNVGEPGALGNHRTYDAVSAMDVLFHIVDETQWRHAFANIASVLRPGGIFVLSDNFLRAGTKRAETQVSRSLGEFRDALAANGFEILTRRPVFALMNTPVDTTNRAYHALWRLTTRVASRSERLGNLAGAVLYPLELVLTSLLREGPSTEIMICRRSSARGLD